MFVLFFILLIHFVVSFIAENLNRKPLYAILNIFLLLFVLFFTLGITYNADWLLYEWFYDNYKIDQRDFVYTELSKIFNSFYLPYEDLYIFHLLVYTFLFYLLIRKFTWNYFYVFLIYFFLDYVHYTNQIRYYLGFPIMIFGLYYLLYRKNYILSVGLIVLAILCHSALALLLLFLLAFYFIPTKKYIKISLIISVFFAAVIFVLMQGGLGLVIKHYDNYLSSENESSIIGGIFNSLPYMVYLTYLVIEYYRIKKKYDIDLEHPKTVLLFKLAYFPLILSLGSIFLQIIGHRYIMPLSIFGFLFYLQIIKDLPQNVKFAKMLIFTIINFVAIFSIYYLPEFVLKESHFMNELEKTLKSIPYLKDFLDF